MKLLSPTGRTYQVNIAKYKVDWNAKCRSKFQFNVKQFLKPYLLCHVVCEEFRIPGTKLTCDLIDFSTHNIFEAQGIQHIDYNKFFHNGSKLNFLNQIKRDQDKSKWAENNGFTLVEIFPDDVLNKQWFLDKYNITL